MDGPIFFSCYNKLHVYYMVSRKVAKDDSFEEGRAGADGGACRLGA